MTNKEARSRQRLFPAQSQNRSNMNTPCERRIYLGSGDESTMETVARSSAFMLFFRPK